MVRLVICRRDLPANPHWREEGYPEPYCWDIDEFFEAAERGEVPREEARRIWWEAYWRRLGRYKRGRPFWETYLCTDHVCKPFENRKLVIHDIIAAGYAHGLVPAYYGPRLYELLFGKPEEE